MQIPTVTIQSGAKSGVTIINEEDFDPKTMKKAGEKKPAKKPAK